MVKTKWGQSDFSVPLDRIVLLPRGKVTLTPYLVRQQEKLEELLAARVRPYVDQHYWLPLYSMGAFATQNWTMGDLNRQTFMEAWNSEPFVRLREAHLRRDVRGTVCEKCVAYS
jgi:hypothetical protein